MPQREGHLRWSIIAAFLAVVAGVLFVANWVIFAAGTLLFAIQAPLARTLVAVFLGVSTASFIAATFIGMRAYNRFTRMLYRLSAVWVGVLAYLFLCSVAAIILVALFGPSAFLAILLILIPFLLGVYGYLHARVLMVKHVDVVLENLPIAWEGKRVIWVSDVHLGQLHGPAFAHKVTRTINSIPHDIVFIGGDLYDGTGAPDIAELVAPFAACTAPLGVYFITGNHEEFGDSERFVTAVRAAGIKPIIDEMIEIDGIQIIGVDYQHASEKESFRKILTRMKIDLGKPSILLKHEPKDIDVAAHAGISFQISGHTHKAQLWPFEYIARLAYRGFAYGLKRAGKMQVYVSSGVGTWGPPMRVGTDSEVVVFILRREE